MHRDSMAHELPNVAFGVFASGLRFRNRACRDLARRAWFPQVYRSVLGYPFGVTNWGSVVTGRARVGGELAFSGGLR